MKSECYDSADSGSNVQRERFQPIGKRGSVTTARKRLTYLAASRKCDVALTHNKMVSSFSIKQMVLYSMRVYLIYLKRGFYFSFSFRKSDVTTQIPAFVVLERIQNITNANREAHS